MVLLGDRHEDDGYRGHRLGKPLYHVRPRGFLAQNLPSIVMLLLFVVIFPIAVVASAAPAFGGILLCYNLLEKRSLCEEKAVNLFRLASISPFVRTFLQHIQAVGLPIALAQAFDDCNIRLVVQGETTGWNAPGKAVLLIGNHRSGFEQVLLMALLGSFQRCDLSIIAIPGMGASRAFELVDQDHESRYTLPVLPSLLAKDRKDIWNHFVFYRFLHSRSLPTRAALHEENLHTLSKAAHLLEQGYAIIVFPVGHKDVDIRDVWQRGIGEIVSRLSASARANVMMGLFRLEEDYSKSALAKAFVVRSLGRVPKHRSFTLRLGQQVTCLDLVGQKSDPLVITEIVRKQYLESFF